MKQTTCLLLVIFLVVACRQEHKSEPAQPAAPSMLQQEAPLVVTDSAKAPLTFLDSVLRRDNLTIEQIKCHTRIDSIHYTKSFSRVTFRGDTVINLAYGLKGVILTYDNLNCWNKFLLIMDSAGKNAIDYREVYSQCDRDGDESGYWTLDYRFLSDSLFETIETIMPDSADIKHLASETEVSRWRVGRNGMIEVAMQSTN